MRHEYDAPQHEPTPADVPQAAAQKESRGASPSRRPHRLLTSSLRLRNLVGATLAILVVLACLMAFTGRLDTLAQSLLHRLINAPPKQPAPTPEKTEAPAGAFAFTDLALHPDRLFRPYLAGPIFSSVTSETRAGRIQRFRAFLDLYVQSRSGDSNFTIRVLDDRSGDVLEVFTLEEEKAQWKRLGQPLDYDWPEIDALRRRATNRLVDKYAARGMPMEAITVRWGRAQQIKAAHRRAAPYIEYEIALARHLGLSLLATAFSIQETFNQDKLISSAGARSRYQMMPYLLRRNGINHYTLSTLAGDDVHVYESWHPLLTMETSFLILSGYINAVGHEIPGLSAYHTGPGNIFHVYREFLTHESGHFSPATTVMDAYMWAVTDGFETVTDDSSFGPNSRAYVASIYGMFKGVDGLPIDTSKTLRTDRLQMEAGESIYLSKLLSVLDRADAGLDWGPFAPEGSLYERFRRMNPHFDLPESEGPGVPVEGDVQLVAQADGDPVRFFLPPHADMVLRAQGYDLFDEAATFTFNHDTYPDPRSDAKTLWDSKWPRRRVLPRNPDPCSGTRTLWDCMYDALVRDIAHFGFTPENHRRLEALQARFEQMAEENPTHYRKAQLQIINTHAHLWEWSGFEKLMGITQAVMGERRAPVLPPDPLAVPHSPSVFHPFR